MKQNLPSLDYFLEWRPYLWKPVVKWLISDSDRFRNKHILELGYRSGRMSCYFALLGATVTGLEIGSSKIETAYNEARKWNVQNSINFCEYDGNLSTLSKDKFDFVFTKSVLVTIPNLFSFLSQIDELLNESGELIAAENLKTNRTTSFIISKITHSRLRLKPTFSGVDESFLSTIKRVFRKTEIKKHLGLVVGIRGVR